jgi:thymidylate synthase
MTLNMNIEIIVSSERFFVIDSKNQILDIEDIETNEEYVSWILEQFEMSNVLSEQDLQHYTQLKNFFVIQLPFISKKVNEQTVLTIPYTFKLKKVYHSKNTPIILERIKLLHYVQCLTNQCMETPYLTTVKQIIGNGELREDRTGTGTISIFGNQIRFDISEYVPLLTTKFVPWKSCIQELLWFLKGRTDSKELEAVKVNIWKDNTTREFLDQRGLTHLPDGDIGAGYGFQWRHFGADYKDCHTDYTGEGFDQIADVIHQLKENPTSRRIMFSAWNPSFLGKMALPPCHVLCQFYVSFKDNQKYLSCQMYQRSQDVFLGAPFNIFSYTALTYLLAKMCDMKPQKLIISSGDTHIYKDHIEQMKEQVRRIPLSSPILRVSDTVTTKNIDDITIQDFDLDGYFYHPRLYGKMSV